MSLHGKMNMAKPTMLMFALQKTSRSLPSDVQNMYLTSQKTDANGQNILVPLASVAKFEESLGAAQIHRRDLAREVLVEANTCRTSCW